MWTAVTVVIVVVGVALVAWSVSENKNQANAAPTIGDHWHAFLGIDVCGQWLPNAPAFEKRADDPNVASGLHSHADGLMHIEPTSSEDTGRRATVGRFIDYGGWSLSDSSMRLWDGGEHRSGQRCGKGAGAKKAEIQWSVGRLGKPWAGKPRSGNPADYNPKNGDIVGIYFLPRGEKLPKPENADQAFSSNNVSGGAPLSGSGTTAPGGGTGSTPSSAP